MKYKRILFLLGIMVALAGCSKSGNDSQTADTVPSAVILEEDQASDDENADTTKDADSKAQQEASAKSEKEELYEFQPYLIEKTYYDFDPDIYWLSLNDVTYNELYISKESLEAHPELENLNKSLASYNSTLRRDMKNIADNMKDASLFEYEQGNINEENAYSNHLYRKCTTEIRRSDSVVFSAIHISKDLTDPEMGSTVFITANNFDSMTGEEISLRDVITDEDLLKEKVIEALGETYPYDDWSDLEEELENYGPEAADDYIWVLDPQGITFFFSPMMISYMNFDNPVSATILYSDAPKLFKDPYTKAPKDFSLCFSENSSEIRMDLDDDGVLDRISLEIDRDESYYSDSYPMIRVNKMNYRFDDYYGYTSDSTLVHRNGKTYLYWSSFMDNDYNGIYVFELAPDRIKYLDCLSGELTLPDSIPEEGRLYVPLMNTEHFYLLDVTQTISTASAVQECSLSDNGLLKDPNALAYINNEYCTITSNTDLYLDVVDEEGNVVQEDYGIPAGNVFTLYRTDKVSFTDCKLKNGKIVRLHFTDDWPRIIDGEYDLEEVFDDVMFAG